MSTIWRSPPDSSVYTRSASLETPSSSRIESASSRSAAVGEPNMPRWATAPMVITSRTEKAKGGTWFWGT